MITKSRSNGDVVGPDPLHARWVCESVEVNPERQNESSPPGDSTFQPGFQEPLLDQSSWTSTSAGSESISYSTKHIHNTCLHNLKRLSLSGESYPVVFRLQDEPPGSYVWRINGRIENLPALCGVYVNGIRGRSELGLLDGFNPSWGPYWAQDYSGRAVRTMWPGVQAGNLSAVNFLLELKDFRRSYTSAKKIRKTMLGISRLARSAMKKGTSRKERLALLKRVAQNLELSKVAAEANLEYSFAYAPFVADCQKIWQNLQGISAECDRIRNHVGRWLTSHYAEHIPAPGVSTASMRTPYAYPWNPDPNAFTVKRRSEYTESMYHATMDYTYDLRPEEAWALKWRVTLDRLGINLNPAIAWNAYPWTFAVDWAVRVGDFLDQFKLTNVRPIVSILGFCHSVKSERVTTLHVVQGDESVYSRGPEVLAAHETELTYIREPYVPNYYSALQLSGISLREFSLAASLYRVRKHGRRFRNG